MNKPLSRKSNIVVQDLENEVLIYDLSINKAFCLNQTSAMVYQLCDGKRTVAEISDEMSKKLKTLVSEDFVWLALKELERENLLENAEQLNNYFAGMSRREVVKKVGLASMIALPIISSVVAPSAAMAQSGVVNQPLFASCTSPANCTSGNCVSGSNPTATCCASSTMFIAIQPGQFDCVPLGSDCSQYCCSGSGTIGSFGSCGLNLACGCPV